MSRETGGESRYKRSPTGTPPLVETVWCWGFLPDAPHKSLTFSSGGTFPVTRAWRLRSTGQLSTLARSRASPPLTTRHPSPKTLR